MIPGDLYLILILAFAFVIVSAVRLTYRDNRRRARDARSLAIWSILGVAAAFGILYLTPNGYTTAGKVLSGVLLVVVGIACMRGIRR